MNCNKCGTELTSMQDVIIQTVDGELIKKSNVICCKKCGFWKEQDGLYGSEKPRG